ncbi:MAG: 3'(2'),5'-bisphosphate nucleotidase CysQ [Bacteroidales bacterium]
MEELNLNKLLEISINATIVAGKKICEIYQNTFDVKYKEDHSPLTIADLKSNEVIQSFLLKTGIPILSEEGKSIPYQERKEWDILWIVDPLDGTKEFVKRNGEFTVNIALIENGIPALGVIYVPVRRCLYFASEITGSLKVENIAADSGSFDLKELLKKGSILPLEFTNRTYKVVGSKSHMTKETEDYIDELKKHHSQIEVLSKGSSLKICMVAEGEADEYPRFAPTMEWDIAAGHAIVKYSGGSLINYDTQKEMTYNRETMLNPWFLVKKKGLCI